MADYPPKKNVAFDFAICLYNSLGLVVTNAPLAIGDVSVSTDFGAVGNITTLPIVLPALSDQVKVSLSALEMNGDVVHVWFRDQTLPKAWMDCDFTIITAAAQMGDVATLGTGAIAYVITATDPGAIPLDGVHVWVSTDLAGTNIVAAGYTDALGHVTFMLDVGNYFAWKQLAGYNFTNPEAFAVP